MKPTVLVLKAILPDEMKLLGVLYNVIPFWEQAEREDVLAKQGAGVSAILSTYDCEGVKGDLMARLPNLRIIGQFGAGYDNIDLKAAKERGIAVTNTPDVLTDDTADLAMQLLLNVARRGIAGDRFVREGEWMKGGFPLSTSLSGKVAGIYGMGKIGQAIARRAAAHNMKIKYCSRSPKSDIPYDYYGKLTALAEACDFLILACSGGPETRHTVDREVLRAIGPQGYLINIARGSVVKEDDLIAALEAGEIAGAGLDVFANEPDVPSALLKMDQVVLSPHVGSATRETRSLMGRLVVENLNAFFEGKPLLTPVLT
ncbi:MAG: 2-hydroxyacid dehydrogenase [Alphaproteobacteria bacterium]|nr:2-hydroxyacid dehydrogenase [Alphaproteobacteria bacterium]MBP7759237.1 2-hydroxyacid dehydrogenase [Alphaproteobacteria bacterium]MBP7761871.1 2-hydroxyacid dehydrogenase [Alphaproteobacteria bacterium]MBP7904684.1 2-hydroxyacid dehydrogenase [Alphaproteobacteria bacterium]